MPPEFKEELTKLENIWRKKANTHAWIVSVVSLISVAVIIFTVYGKSISALDLNEKDHLQFITKEKILEIKIDNVIKNQNMIYYNLLIMAKRQGMKLTSNEELFLNNEAK